MMFTEELWNSWILAEESNYKIAKSKDGILIRKYLKKGYLHFDNRFWFPERQNEIKNILKNGLKVFNPKKGTSQSYAFIPFLKIVTKTPRFKYQSEINAYGLETKTRPICFASHIDSLILGFYAHGLSRKYEKYVMDRGLSDNILAYRSNLEGKCNIQFSKEVFEEVKKRGQCSAIALDIKGYFDNINHIILKEKWIKVLGESKLPPDQFKIFKAITQYSYVNKISVLKRYNIILKKLKRTPNNILELVPGKNSFEKFDKLRLDRLIVTNNKPKEKPELLKGIPQGSPISALLSNIYLIDFDALLMKKSFEEGFLYRRYCDDILVVCDNSKVEILQAFIIDLIKEKYQLTIQDKKVELIEFQKNSKGKIRAFNKKKMLISKNAVNSSNEQRYYKNLQYLGFEYNGQDVFLRSSSLSRYFRKMKSRIEKTISMSYSKNSKSNKIWLQQLFHRYTHLGKRNFIKYAYNASSETYINSYGEKKEGINSAAIKKQLRRHFNVLIRSLEIKNSIRFNAKSKNQDVVLRNG